MAFMAMGELYQWTRVAIGLKGAGPYIQRSMSNTVLAGLLYQISELYIDDVLIHGWVMCAISLDSLREFNIAVRERMLWHILYSAAVCGLILHHPQDGSQEPDVPERHTD
jgi:hypothetical protein